MLPVWQAVRDFMEVGGTVMWGIFAVSTIMWTVIIERYVFIAYRFPRELAQIEQQFSESMTHSWAVESRRRGAAAERLANALWRRLLLIRSLAAALPMLGLLGTVLGMMECFHVMTISGSANVRGMAGGVSIALTTTLAGLVTALPGYALGADLRRRASEGVIKSAHRLTQPTDVRVE